MANRPDGRNIANSRTEGVDDLFYNDRLDRDGLSVTDYPARVDQAAQDLLYGVSLGKSKNSNGNPLSGSGTVGKFDFGRATGSFYKQGLEAIATDSSDLPRLIEQYDSQSVGDLAFRLNELRHDLQRIGRTTSEAQITDINRVLEAVLEKVITRSMHSADENVTRQSISEPETVTDLMHQIFSDPSSTAYAEPLFDIIEGPSDTNDILGVLDSPEMVTPLWNHQQEAIANWVDHECSGYVDMATATGKTVLGLAAIATLCGRLHPNDEAAIDRDDVPVMDGRQRVLVVAGQDLLLEQWRSEFDEHLNIPRDRTGAEAGIREIELKWGTIEFKTAQELLAAESARGYDIVILDEAHQYSRGSQSGRGWRTVLEELADSSKAILAMSGSVDQGWLGDDAAENALTENLPLCKRFTVPEARDAGVIADFAWTTVYAAATKNESQAKLAKTTAPLAGVYDEDDHKFDINRVDPAAANEIKQPFETLTDLRSFSQSQAGSTLREKSTAFDDIATAGFSRRPQRWQLTPDPDSIADLVAAHAPEQQTVVLVQSYNQAETVGAAIQDRIGDDLVVVPKADADDQFDLVEQFKSGEYQVIVGPGTVLGTGVDMPDADVAINVSRGGVNASLIQRIGRVLRNPTGDKQAQFYHIVTLPSDNEAIIPGEDGRRLMRRAAEFRALGARLRELPGFTAFDSAVDTVGQLEQAGIEALIADRRAVPDIVDDEVAQQHLDELIEGVTTQTDPDKAIFLAEWSNQTLDRETEPMQVAIGNQEQSPADDGSTNEDETEDVVPIIDEALSEDTDPSAAESESSDDTTDSPDTPDERTETATDADTNTTEAGTTDDLTTVSGVDETTATALRDNGFETIADLKAASQDSLSEIDAVGPTAAARIKLDVGSAQEADAADNPQSDGPDQAAEPEANEAAPTVEPTAPGDGEPVVTRVPRQVDWEVSHRTPATRRVPRSVADTDTERPIRATRRVDDEAADAANDTEDSSADESPSSLLGRLTATVSRLLRP